MRYSKAIVTFLDILGFRDLVANDSPEEVDRKLNALERITGPVYITDDPHDRQLEPSVFWFSDSVVRVRHLETEANIEAPTGLLFHELLDMVYAQGELIKEGILLRGGVTYGEVVSSSSRVFGPGVIKAYEVESKLALYPRVALAPELLKELRRNPLLKSEMHTPKDERDYIGQLLRRGDDGVWFVDYATAIEEELDDIDRYPIFLNCHRDIIVNGSTRFLRRPNTLRKYLWLAYYHNSVLDAKPKSWFRRYGTTKNKLSITAKEMPALQNV